MYKTKIEWCDMTWNPVTGCLHGCEYCYAKTLAETRLKHIYPNGFDPTMWEDRLDEPQKIKKSQNIFVCSMADLFGDWVPDEWIQEVFKACEAAPWHRYLFLTKNPKRYDEALNQNGYIVNKENKVISWLGTTITNQKEADAIDNDEIKPYVDFLSIEPISDEIDISRLFKFEVKQYHCIPGKAVMEPDYGEEIKALKWVIIGAETGNRKDKIIPKREWIENIVEQCRRFDVPVFMKNSLAKIWGKGLIQEYPWEV